MVSTLVAKRPNCGLTTTRKFRYVFCNSSGGSESRVRFQTARDATSTHVRHQAHEPAKLWVNGALTQNRRQTPQVRAIKSGMLPGGVMDETGEGDRLICFREKTETSRAVGEPCGRFNVEVVSLKSSVC